MDSPNLQLDLPDPRINPAVYFFLPPEQAQYQLDHIDESKASQIIISHFICLGIACVATTLRFISRGLCKARYQANDFLILISFVFFVVYVSMVLLVVFRYGGGQHAILLKDPIKFAKIVMVAEILYAPAIGFIKLSTIALYSHLFSFRGVRFLLWGIAAVVTAASTANVFSIIFQCHPISGAWNPIARFTGHCINLDDVMMSLAGINVLTDLAILAVPIPHLWRLQVPPSTKAQLFALFCVGGFVLIVSIYRIPILNRVSLADASWTNASPTIWTVVEVSMAMLCASALTYRPLFTKILHKRSSTPLGIRAQSRETLSPGQHESPKRKARGCLSSIYNSILRTETGEQDQDLTELGEKSRRHRSDSGFEVFIESTGTPSHPPLQRKISKTILISVQTTARSSFDDDLEAAVKRCAF